MQTFTHESELLVPAPIDKVFDFFSRAENLEKITPDGLKFEILTPMPIEMKQGAIIDYRLRLMGIPFGWKTEITLWEPGKRFMDVQRKGPYLKWEHTHAFEAKGGQTLMKDRVDYAVPGGPLAPLIQKLFVGGQVRQIFNHRNKVIAEFFQA